jgi:hypothetical protein
MLPKLGIFLSVKGIKWTMYINTQYNMQYPIWNSHLHKRQLHITGKKIHQYKRGNVYVNHTGNF